MIQKLSPLHHHHGELVRVLTLVPVHNAADYARIRQRPVRHRPPEFFYAITKIILVSLALFQMVEKLREIRHYSILELFLKMCLTLPNTLYL